MADSVALLQQLGFSEYEARAYRALLQRSPLNGYELAKAAGLPRANVYAVLQKLEERNAVVRQESPTGVRYAPVPPGELTQRIEQHFHATLDAAQHELNAIFSPPDPAYIWNIHGQAALLEHARAQIGSVHEQLTVAIWPAQAQALAEAINQAEQRGVAITTLCLNACAVACAGCRGQLYRYRVAPQQSHGWLILIADGAELLAGEISPDASALAIRTRQALLVDMIGWYIRHSIALAAVLNDLGSQLERIIEPETRAILRAIGAQQPGGDWLEEMRRLLHHDER
jgi:predicted transcriptional regulator